MYPSRRPLKQKLLDVFFASIAILAGGAIVYLGDYITGIKLEMFTGIIDTFTPLWIANLIIFPFVAGIVVSAIYGLGGKILSYFAPLLVRIPEYWEATHSSISPEFGTVLPIGFWILILIVVVEASGGGGIVGEIIIKRTYGRRPKDQIYKRYQVRSKADSAINDTSADQISDSKGGQ